MTADKASSEAAASRLSFGTYRALAFRAPYLAPYLSSQVMRGLPYRVNNRVFPASAPLYAATNEKAFRAF